jgi:hypothetical protein
MNFALNLRRCLQQEKGFTLRIIYVAPFISILDQNTKVFQDLFQIQQQQEQENQQQQTNLLLMYHHLAPVTYIKNMIEEQRGESYST